MLILNFLFVVISCSRHAKDERGVRFFEMRKPQDFVVSGKGFSK